MQEKQEISENTKTMSQNDKEQEVKDHFDGIGEKQDFMKKKIDISSNIFLLTYKGKISKQLIRIFIEKVNQKDDIDEIFISHETGKTGYEHTHVVCKWKCVFRVTATKKFDYKGIHPNIKVVKKNNKKFDPWVEAVKYICKEDKETYAEVLEKHGIEFFTTAPLTIVERIQKCNTLNEALNQFVHENGKTGQIVNAKAVIDVFSNKEKESCTREDDIILDEYNWQKQLRTELSQDPIKMPLDYYQTYHKRKVIWIYDPEGGCGKSSFIQNFSLMNPKWGICLPNITNTNGIAHVLISAFNAKDWLGKVVFIDLPRKQADYEINGTIEQLKNGSMNSVKYQGGDLSIASPHVVIFANQLPNKEQINGFTKDRWDIRQIGEGMKMIRLAKIDFEDSWFPKELEYRMKPAILDRKQPDLIEYEEECGEEYESKIAASFSRYAPSNGIGVSYSREINREEFHNKDINRIKHKAMKDNLLELENKMEAMKLDYENKLQELVKENEKLREQLNGKKLTKLMF